MNEKIRKLLRDGEGLTVEFKRCRDKLSRSVYETVCAFSNRYGGDMLIGVEDDGTVTGVAPDAVKRLKKDFANALNNPELFSPTLFVELDDLEVDGRVILYCHIPLTSQLQMYNRKIYDRNEDGDYDVTKNTETAGLILDRKRGISSESRVFPHITEDDLLLGTLMPKVRNMATMRVAEHPWTNMPDMDVLKSASLYQTTKWAETTGFTLAAILLFGREEVIRSVVPGYVTDCILRRDDLDRYDDRLRVSCNLIEAYSEILGFISRHTLDRFYLEGALTVSPRSKIARELVSNILSHREFTSTVPAKVIIERDRIVTENWCLPKRPGKLDPATFTPQPKNPLIANFFVNISYADTLGSGVRNLYKYTRIYTNGGEPELFEGDIFRTVVPLSLTDVSDKRKMSDNVSYNYAISDKTSDNVSETRAVSETRTMIDKANGSAVRDKLLEYLRHNGDITAAEAAKAIGRSMPTARRLLVELVSEGLATTSGANRNRRYHSTRL